MVVEQPMKLLKTLHHVRLTTAWHYSMCDITDWHCSMSHANELNTVKHLILQHSIPFHSCFLSIFQLHTTCHGLPHNLISADKPAAKLLTCYGPACNLMTRQDGPLCRQQVRHKLCWVTVMTRSLAIAKRLCDCCIILKSWSYTKPHSADRPISIKSRS